MNNREIKLRVHEEASLFSDLDPDQRKLSEDVVGYLNYNYLKMHRNRTEHLSSVSSVIRRWMSKASLSGSMSIISMNWTTRLMPSSG